MNNDKRVDQLIEALFILIKKMDKTNSKTISDKVLLAMMERVGKSRSRTFGSNY